jgi:hypothetical protein
LCGARRRGTVGGLECKCVHGLDKRRVQNNGMKITWKPPEPAMIIAVQCTIHPLPRSQHQCLSFLAVPCFKESLEREKGGWIVGNIWRVEKYLNEMRHAIGWHFWRL